FLTGGLVDELQLVMAPFFVGDPGAPRFAGPGRYPFGSREPGGAGVRSEEHTSELQSLTNLVCRLLLEKKKTSEMTPELANNRATQPNCSNHTAPKLSLRALNRHTADACYTLTSRVLSNTHNVRRVCACCPQSVDSSCLRNSTLTSAVYRISRSLRHSHSLNLNSFPVQPYAIFNTVPRLLVSPLFFFFF